MCSTHSPTQCVEHTILHTRDYVRVCVGFACSRRYDTNGSSHKLVGHERHSLAEDDAIAQDVLVGASGQLFAQNRLDPAEHFRLELRVALAGQLHAGSS